MDAPLLQVRDLNHSFLEGEEKVHALRAVSYTHLTLPTNREV